MAEMAVVVEASRPAAEAKAVAEEESKPEAEAVESRLVEAAREG